MKTVCKHTTLTSVPIVSFHCEWLSCIYTLTGDEDNPISSNLPVHSRTGSHSNFDQLQNTLLNRFESLKQIIKHWTRACAFKNNVILMFPEILESVYHHNKRYFLHIQPLLIPFLKCFKSMVLFYWRRITKRIGSTSSHQYMTDVKQCLVYAEMFNSYIAEIITLIIQEELFIQPSKLDITFSSIISNCVISPKEVELKKSPTSSINFRTFPIFHDQQYYQCMRKFILQRNVECIIPIMDKWISDDSIVNATMNHCAEELHLMGCNPDNPNYFRKSCSLYVHYSTIIDSLSLARLNFPERELDHRKSFKKLLEQFMDLICKYFEKMVDEYWRANSYKNREGLLNCFQTAENPEPIVQRAIDLTVEPAFELFMKTYDYESQQRMVTLGNLLCKFLTIFISGFMKTFCSVHSCSRRHSNRKQIENVFLRDVEILGQWLQRFVDNVKKEKSLDVSFLKKIPIFDSVEQLKDSFWEEQGERSKSYALPASNSSSRPGNLSLKKLLSNSSVVPIDSENPVKQKDPIARKQNVVSKNQVIPI